MLCMEDVTPALAKSAIDDAQKAVATSRLGSRNPAANGGDLASRLKVVVTRLEPKPRLPFVESTWQPVQPSRRLSRLGAGSSRSQAIKAVCPMAGSARLTRLASRAAATLLLKPTSIDNIRTP
ncbi:hypothetical protein B0H13DRAFT_1850625 [Mycena leptocephala]|nr:hypothetical protein B0H13DRAFT_1850625 [Mycena leptocephala]